MREAVFSILGEAVAGCRFLDLYAGTGAVGLEALSRGAESVDFIETDREAARLIRENIQRTGLNRGTQIYTIDLPNGLERFEGHGPYDFVYADPPHAFADYDALFGALGKGVMLAPRGVVLLEHASKIEPASRLASFERFRSARYGETTVSFYAPSTREDTPGRD